MLVIYIRVDVRGTVKNVGNHMVALTGIVRHYYDLRPHEPEFLEFAFTFALHDSLLLNWQ